MRVQLLKSRFFPELRGPGPATPSPSSPQPRRVRPPVRRPRAGSGLRVVLGSRTGLPSGASPRDTRPDPWLQKPSGRGKGVGRRRAVAHHQRKVTRGGNVAGASRRVSSVTMPLRVPRKASRAAPLSPRPFPHAQPEPMQAGWIPHSSLFPRSPPARESSTWPPGRSDHPPPDALSPAISSSSRPSLLTAGAAAALRPQNRRPRPSPGREPRAPPQWVTLGSRDLQASSGACCSRVVGRPSAR